MRPREPMIGIPHEIGLGRSAADTVCFMDEGRALGSAPAGKFSASPKSARNRTFLSRILY